MKTTLFQIGTHENGPSFTGGQVATLTLNFTGGAKGLVPQSTTIAKADPLKFAGRPGFELTTAPVMSEADYRDQLAASNEYARNEY